MLTWCERRDSALEAPSGVHRWAFCVLAAELPLGAYANYCALRRNAQRGQVLESVLEHTRAALSGRHLTTKIPELVRLAEVQISADDPDSGAIDEDVPSIVAQACGCDSATELEVAAVIGDTLDSIAMSIAAGVPLASDARVSDHHRLQKSSAVVAAQQAQLEIARRLRAPRSLAEIESVRSACVLGPKAMLGTLVRIV